jgi:DNA-binding transcriptional ArsR family regulator
MNSRLPQRDGAGLAALAGLLADPTRATMCLALMDGRAWTAAELARQAGVAPSTATEHLNLLVDGGLLTDVRQGRHRYVRLAGTPAADLVERLASAAGDVRRDGATAGSAGSAGSLTAVHRRRALAAARTCYDHLAGRLGVAVTDALTARGYLSWDRGLTLTDDGDAWFAVLLDGASWPPASRRPVVRPCLDWTERRPHLGGAAGAALCTHAVEAGWVVRAGRTRALRLTDTGRSAFRDVLGLELA